MANKLSAATVHLSFHCYPQIHKDSCFNILLRMLTLE